MSESCMRGRDIVWCRVFTSQAMNASHSEFKPIESAQLINLDRDIGHILQLTFKYKIKITAQDALVHSLKCRVLKVADKVPHSSTNHVVHLEAMS